ncbi:MAG TPA: protein-glutamate O-methyltransferase CheR [Clostridiaceae bacterium]|nr:protein-glutamate O-methyltransferase CheR [Clostridiaceae bacterium]
MDYEGFKKEIYALTGINLSYYKEKQMKRRIDALIRKHDIDNYEKYIERIKVDRQLFNEFINYITINVSEFYRNPEQWEILEKDILPHILAKSRSPRIWSAACSTGDEPYTIVMILNKYLPLDSIRIDATDIDEQALERARTGIYNYKSIEKLPADLCRKYFEKKGDLYCIKEEVKKCVRFYKHDLLADRYPSDCDLIVCRNVLIYFTEEAKNMIYTKFSKSLKDGGVLFVGSTEQIIMAAKYNFNSLRTFFYIKGNVD